MENQNKITVFGATGKVGKEVLTFLSNASIPTIAVTRNKSKVKEIPFVEWVEADMGDKKSLYKTIKNSKGIFLSSSVSEKFVEEQGNVISVAKEQGVQHIVKLSSPGVAKDSPFFIGKLNYEAEEILKASGINWTMLQPNSFMQNWLGGLSETVKSERKIYEGAGDGKKPFIDTKDIAEVAAVILQNPQEHINQTYLLTADEAISYYQIADAITNAIGEKVTYEALSMDDFKIRMQEKNVPQFMIHTYAAISDAQRNGNTAFVNSVVRDILKKPSRTIDEFTHEYVSWFK